MRFHIITISGMPGSGKSTVAKELARRLGYRYYSTGMAQRAIADQHNLTTLELNQLADTDPSIDQELDGVFQNITQVPNQSFVIDARMAFFFLPGSIKIKLDVDLKIAGERIFSDTSRTGERQYASVDEVIDDILKRRKSEVERFKRVYHVDIDNNENFDCIIDTSYKSVDDICSFIIQKYQLQPMTAGTTR